MKIIRNFIDLFARRKGAKTETTINIDFSKGMINKVVEQDPVSTNAPTPEIRTEFETKVTKA